MVARGPPPIFRFCEAVGPTNTAPFRRVTIGEAQLGLALGAEPDSSIDIDFAVARPCSLARIKRSCIS